MATDTLQDNQADFQVIDLFCSRITVFYQISKLIFFKTDILILVRRLSTFIKSSSAKKLVFLTCFIYLNAPLEPKPRSR